MHEFCETKQGRKLRTRLRVLAVTSFRLRFPGTTYYVLLSLRREFHISLGLVSSYPTIQFAHLDQLLVVIP